MRDDVENFIDILRKAHPDMELIYTKGGCYRLFQLLRTCFPTAEAWWDYDHVYSKIGDAWYDITGKHTKCPPDTVPMSPDIQARAKNWRNNVISFEEARGRMD